MYENGRGVKRDLKHALELFKRSADCGNEYGQMNLRRLYEEGKGVERNYKRAAEQ